MSRTDFYQTLQNEVVRIDASKTSKRNEKIIEGFTKDESHKALINGNEVRVFNSNDYLGLRHHEALKKAEHEASEMYGTGPGAVRFISGSLKVHRDLERAVAKFHGRDDAMVFSSAFATNMATLFCLIVGQSKDTLVDSNVFVVSDALNHRSIIDGIRIANLPKEQKTIFKHLDVDDLRRILEENKSKYHRALVVTDGVFSMLGEYQHLDALRALVDEYDAQYPQGVLLVVDDCHGVGACGATGRGTEEVKNAKADVLVGTFGKGFGSDGGYVVGPQAFIDYMRESAATYIYSNSISPGTAAAALCAVTMMDEAEGHALLESSQKGTEYFKEKMKTAGFRFAADSTHPIQPVLIGDPDKTKQLVNLLFEKNIPVTQISYPVVAKGNDEIRVQIAATHTTEDIDALIAAFIEAGKELELI